MSWWPRFLIDHIDWSRYIISVNERKKNILIKNKQIYLSHELRHIYIYEYKCVLNDI